MKPYRILLPLLLIAFWLRIWHLPETPPGLWYDEAYYAMDARWMADTGHYPLFFVGNNGREPMWPYLILASTSILGNTPLALRWLGALAGLLTIPIIYRFVLALSRPFVRPARQRTWLALAAAGWLTVSWWHLLNSRAGFRPVLLPPLLMLSLYFFWQGCRGAGVQGCRGAGVQGCKGAGVQDHGPRNTQYVSRSPFPVPRFTPFALAGLCLGLSQYTYLSARVAPAIFAGLALLWTGQAAWSHRRSEPNGLRTTHHARQVALPGGGLPHLWLGLAVTLAIAGLVFAPLGLFFLQHPGTFSSRTGDVLFSPDNPGKVLAHLLQGVSLFLGAGHELYRHHLPGRAMLGWLEIPFFWLGLAYLLAPSRRGRPETAILLLGLGVMWLPALLASPPVHSLRPIGLLPFYYSIVAIGSYGAMSWLASRAPLAAGRRQTSALQPSNLPALQPSNLPTTCPIAGRVQPSLIALGLLIFISLNGLINTYDYFWRWAERPEVYEEYNGPLVDLTRELIELTNTTDVIIPFHLYAHPTTRFLLHGSFPEVSGIPPANLGRRPLEMLIVPNNFQLLYVGNIPASPALVLLTRDEAGRGAAYVSRPPRAGEQAGLDEWLAAAQPSFRPVKDQLGRAGALLAPLPGQPDPAATPTLALLRNLFAPAPLRTSAITWGLAGPLVRLDGYDVTPDRVLPGQPVTLNLYWHSLTEETFDYRLFLQLIDGAGRPVNQWEGEAFGEDMYRWRPDGLLPTQHILWTGPDTPPGPYLVRLGFFDQKSGERLPVLGGGDQGPGAGEEVVNQVQLGLFYVSADGRDPRTPTTPLSTTFGDAIKLIGVTLPDPLSHNSQFLPVVFAWQSLHPTDRPYTVFLQLLDGQGQVISGWDSQPFGGLYPTSLWSPGETIADTFNLPLPEAGLAPGTYRLITGFYDINTGQRLPVTAGGGGDWTQLVEFTVPGP